MIRFLALFTIVPAIELGILLQLADLMGIFQTIALILFTGIVGASLAKSEGVGILNRLASEVRGGQVPAEAMLEAAFIVGGGLLLITPGVMTDVVGFLVVFGPSRRMLMPPAKQWIKARVHFSSSTLDSVEPEVEHAKGHFKHPVK